MVSASCRQQRLDQPMDPDLAAGKRRRPSPLRDWAGSTFVKMVVEAWSRVNVIFRYTCT